MTEVNLVSKWSEGCLMGFSMTIYINFKNENLHNFQKELSTIQTTILSLMIN